jgi:hydrogenase expression/formation protein HypC
MGFALERVDAAGAEQAMDGLELMGRPADTAPGPQPAQPPQGEQHVTHEPA